MRLNPDDERRGRVLRLLTYSSPDQNAATRVSFASSVNETPSNVFENFTDFAAETSRLLLIN